MRSRRRRCDEVGPPGPAGGVPYILDILGYVSVALLGTLNAKRIVACSLAAPCAARQVQVVTAQAGVSPQIADLPSVEVTIYSHGRPFTARCRSRGRWSDCISICRVTELVGDHHIQITMSKLLHMKKSHGQRHCSDWFASNVNASVKVDRNGVVLLGQIR